MNYDFSPEEAAFRADLHAWLLASIPAVRPDPEDEEEFMVFLRSWHRELAKSGWLGLSLPKEAGGRGFAPVYESIFNEEIALTDAPPTPRNVSFIARSLIGFGTAEQQDRFLPALLSTEEMWCQGFSEPGAGSDLASLSTRAVLDGDTYVLNGQKVWTTFGKWADWCLVLARTDPGVPKHKGISAIAVRMDSPGITVRPIHQIDHSEELSEVFFDDVRVPASQRIGQPGDGWRLAMQTVAFERGPADVGSVARNSRLLLQLERAARQGQFDGVPDVRRRLARMFVHMEVLRLHVLRSLTAREKGAPGPEGSVDKLMVGRCEQELARLHLELVKEAALLGADIPALHNYLHSRAMTIYGGAAQIQQNIIAQRVLGMPAGPKS
jgi:alkylation response protein AidB-like acyl-CoA dehydrogenase